MSILVAFLLFAFVALVIATLVMSAVIVPQSTVYIVERLGRCHATLKGGFHLLIPFIDRVAYRRTLKETPIDVPPQQCITKDNINVTVDGIIFLRVMDPVRASYGVDNYIFSRHPARADHHALGDWQAGSRLHL